MSKYSQQDINKNRRLLEKREDVDTDRLYADIPEAIKYMQEVYSRLKPEAYQGKVCLNEHWTGYESMEMTFQYHAFESDEEVIARLDIEAYARNLRAKEKEKKRQKEIRRKQYEALKREFG